MWKTVLRLFLIFTVASAELSTENLEPEEFHLVQAVSQTIARYGPIIRDRFRSPLLVDSFALSPRNYYSQQDSLGGILRNIEQQFPVQFHCDQHPSNHERAVMHNLILIDGRHSFGQFLEHMDERFDTSGIFWVVLHDPSNPRKPGDQYRLLQHIMETLWRKHILYVFVFVIDQQGAVQLYSFFPYGENACGFVEPVLLDWRKDSLFRSRLQQFYGCPLRVGTFENRPFIAIVKDGQGHSQLRGIEGNLVNILSKRLNFSLTIVLPPNDDQWGHLERDGNNTGLMKLLTDGSVDFGISSIGLNSKRVELLSPGDFHFITDMIFAVPSGRSYSAFEKLFLPLSMETWYAICGFVVFALINITIATIQRKGMRAFVFGEDNGAPALNLINVLFGGSLVRCPRRTFARALLMMWILCTLIIRTVYQGSLYKYLQAPKNYSAPSTIDAIQHEGLYFYMLDIHMQYFVNYPRVFDRWVNV